MKKILVYLLLIVFASCGGIKKVSFDDMPSWLKQGPNDSEYFIGVGSASKLGTPDTYMKAARESALADMSQSISVKVTSLSTSNVLEGSDGLHETFQQNVKAKSSEIFEGIELVQQFDDGENYHVYYRISKSEFYRLKKARKQKALSLGLSYFMQAKEQESEGYVSIALTLYVKVLNSIVYYLDESTLISSEAKDIELAYEARSSFDRLAMGLSVNPISKNVIAKAGDFIDDSDLTFLVEHNSQAVLDIPVLFTYSGGFLRQNKDVSDNNGEVSTSLQNLKSNSGEEKIEAVLDLQTIVFKASSNLFIRKLFANSPHKSSNISIHISKTSILLNCEDKDLPYLKRLKGALMNNGFDTDGGNDYALNMSVERIHKKSTYGYKLVYTVNIDLRLVGNNTRQKKFSYTFEARDRMEDKAESQVLAKLNRALGRLIASELTRFVLRH
jgi:hypothetical protein